MKSHRQVLRQVCTEKNSNLLYSLLYLYLYLFFSKMS